MKLIRSARFGVEPTDVSIGATKAVAVDGSQDRKAGERVQPATGNRQPTSAMETNRKPFNSSLYLLCKFAI